MSAITLCCFFCVFKKKNLSKAKSIDLIVDMCVLYVWCLELLLDQIDDDCNKLYNFHCCLILLIAAADDVDDLPKRKKVSTKEHKKKFEYQYSLPETINDCNDDGDDNRIFFLLTLDEVSRIL